MIRTVETQWGGVLGEWNRATGGGPAASPQTDRATPAGRRPRRRIRIRCPRTQIAGAVSRPCPLSGGATNELGVRVAQVHDAEPVALGIGEDDEVRIVRVPVPIDALGAERDETLDLSCLLCCRANVQVKVDPGVLLRRRFALL